MYKSSLNSYAAGIPLSYFSYRVTQIDSGLNLLCINLKSRTMNVAIVVVVAFVFIVVAVVTVATKKNSSSCNSNKKEKS